AAYHLEDRVEVAVPGAVREVADRAAGRRAPAVRETVGLLDAGAREGVGLAGPYPVEEGVQVRDGELPVGVEQDDPVHPGVRDGGGDGGAGAAVLREVDDDQFGAVLAQAGEDGAGRVVAPVVADDDLPGADRG